MERLAIPIRHRPDGEPLPEGHPLRGTQVHLGRFQNNTIEMPIGEPQELTGNAPTHRSKHSPEDQETIGQHLRMVQFIQAEGDIHRSIMGIEDQMRSLSLELIRLNQQAEDLRYSFRDLEAPTESQFSE